MSAPGWLTARPVAHRGLHDAAAGIIENTPSAVMAAVAAGYGIEVDLTLSADGEAMVHHDDRLGRLTEGDARLDTLTADALKRVPFLKTADRMMTLGDLLDLVAGRVALLLEIKSCFDGDRRLVQRVAAVLKRRSDPVAAMSFDPEPIAALRALAPAIPRGIVAERWYRDAEWGFLSPGDKARLAFFLHGFRTRPHFVAYRVKDLPAAAPLVMRRLFGRPLLVWTVRTDSDRRCAERWADQMIFEGFRP